MKTLFNHPIVLGCLWLASLTSCQQGTSGREVVDFNESWQFVLADDTMQTGADWRELNLPHDWSIEGVFSPDHPAGVGGGALPGGIGWYKKAFYLPADKAGQKVFLQFDGVYQNSTVWVNGKELGTRPNGYISFEHDLTDAVTFGQQPNEVLVKVANDPQPNSRWYSGSGIYRKVQLVTTSRTYIPQWGVYISSEIGEGQAKVDAEITVANDSQTEAQLLLQTTFLNASGQEVAVAENELLLKAGERQIAKQSAMVSNPIRWTLDRPHLYRAVTTILKEGRPVDQVETRFGIRTAVFDVDNGFLLNGESVKLKGVCLHHDLGALGAAFNRRAMERQLEIMQGMGVNAIRTAHNPPAPEVLDLCDEMGILVMDEMFDMWAKGKTEFDYSQYWAEWHKRDLEDFIRRDRNHPSIVVWSIGNEIMEQYNHEDSIGGLITRELAGIVMALDSTRAICTANNDPLPDNPLIKYGGLDLIGYNYNHDKYAQFQTDHPGKAFVATETNSSLATRGHYDMPSDSVRIWPEAWDKPFEDGNPGNTVSAYDHVRTPWGSLQEDTWRIVKAHDFISGMFIWTGFDYLGEPTPYVWPSRSSYFGMVDLAGFPKDTYYMYQSEWTADTMLHVFPHWTFDTVGQAVDLWAYFSNADEAELFINGESKGVRRKKNEQYHVMWRVSYQPGEAKVVTRKDGEEVMTKVIKTAGTPHHLALSADRKELSANGYDLSYITVKVLDEDGNIVPHASDEIHFQIKGPGQIIGVDNGDPVSHQSFQGHEVSAFHGLALAIIQSQKESGDIVFQATAKGLVPEEISIKTQNK